MDLSSDIRHILALAPNWLGDAAMCTPALRALKTRFPQAHLTVAGRYSVCDLLNGLPWIDHLVPISTRPGLFRMIQFAARLHPHARDLTVVFPHSFRAAWLAFMTGSRRRLGYQRGARSFCLTDRVAPYQENGQVVPIYMAREYLDLIAQLGCVDDGAGLELRADPTEVERVKERLTGTGPIVGIAPGAAFGPSKRWPAERYAQVADTLVEEIGARCALITGPGEEDTRDAVLQAAKHALLECRDGQLSIARLKATISQLDLLICNDSGPRHIAIAFKKPVICIMGPTSPRYTDGPWEIGRVLRVDVDCGPCQKPTCATDHRCMTRITPEMVVQAAREFLPSE